MFIRGIKNHALCYGDTHGDYRAIHIFRAQKLKRGDTLFICGDFGFIWDGSKNEEKLLKKIGKLKYNVCFIDGTHENFERLRSYEVSEFKGRKKSIISPATSIISCAVKSMTSTA